MEVFFQFEVLFDGWKPKKNTSKKKKKKKKSHGSSHRHQYVAVASEAGKKTPRSVEDRLSDWCF